MRGSTASLGNALHTGEVSVPIVRRRRTWYLISVIVVIVLGSIAMIRGANLSIEFTGGSEFQVSGISQADESKARDVVRTVVPDNEPKVTLVGGSTLRVQTAQLDTDQTQQVAEDLADTYGVTSDDVSTSFIGPVWGSDVTSKMARGVVVFIALVAVVMALYFRNVRVSLAAMITLIHDLLFTAALYGVVGFEVSPATVIGFLTILGYSLYDTIVVFDKIRENTAHLGEQTRRTYAESVELAANQTLMRSLNTSIVALLPVGSILAIGAFVLGAGTLKDISLALFIGIFVGTYSSVFLAPGLVVTLRGRESALVEHEKRVLAARAAASQDGSVQDGSAQDVSTQGPSDEDRPDGDAATAGPRATRRRR